MPLQLSTRAIITAACLAVALTCANAAPSAMSKPGKITIHALKSVAGSGYVIYSDAHVVAENGTTLDSDELKAYLGAGNQLQKITATGHVHAFTKQAESSREYTVTSDDGVFYPATKEIVLTGNVKVVITSPSTQGPLVETGTSAAIKLGPAPDYPLITVEDTVVTFTLPNQ